MKQYLDRTFNLGERCTPFFMIPFVELLGFWLCTLSISLWWKAFIVMMMVGIPIMVVKESRFHWKIRRIFSRHDWRLRDAGWEFTNWLNGLSNDDRSDVPLVYKEDFLAKVEAYVQSHATMTKSYGRTDSRASGQPDAPAPEGSSTTYRFAFNPAERTTGAAEYDYPPENCPSCGKPYQVGDFGRPEVQCRRCGRSIKIRCVISEADRKDIYMKFTQKILREQRNFIICLFVFLSIIGYIIYRQVLAVGGIVAYLQSWHIISAFVFCSFMMGGALCRKKHQRIRRLCTSPQLDLLTLELLLKKDASKGSSVSNEEQALAELKQALFKLYRQKGKVIGTY